MRCIVSTCNNDDSNCISEGITFHSFPTDATLRAAWLKALNKVNWKPLKTSVMCSDHFIKNDLYMARDGQRRIRRSAIPIVNIQEVPGTCGWRKVPKPKACRICFATDCRLYDIDKNNNFGQAYETLTGLMMENENNLYPPYICSECGHRLLNCMFFRNMCLQAHMNMLEILQNLNQITIESLKTASEKHNLLKPKLSITHYPPNHYNLKIEHVVKSEPTGNEDTNEENVFDNTIGSPEHVIEDIKLEYHDIFNQGNNGEDMSDNLPFRPNFEIDAEYFGTESNANFNDTNHSDKIEAKIKDTISDAFVDHEDNPYLDDGKQTSLNTTREVKKITNATKNQPPRTSEADNSDKEKISSDIIPHHTNNESPSQSHLKPYSKLKTLRCNLCNYETVKRRELKYHIKTHYGDKIYPCHVCDMIFKVRGNLTRHLRVHSGEKPFTCDVCKKTFMRPDHYKLHLKVHSGEKAYKCDICNKSFTRQHSYKDHMDVHSPFKLYSCDICKKMFTRKGNLKTHMILHTDERPFSCKVCNKTFRRSNNLQKHFKLHGQKPYSCDVCRKNFKNKSKLKIHLRRHMHAFKCLECNKTFNQKGNLQSHLKNHF